MGIKLYVDDIRPCPDGWTLARTVAEAKLHLGLGGVDALSLDHDMGACDTCINTEPLAAQTLQCDHVECGYDLVVWMIESGRWPATKPIVHSMNPVGRQRMLDAIERHWLDNRIQSR